MSLTSLALEVNDFVRCHEFNEVNEINGVNEIDKVVIDEITAKRDLEGRFGSLSAQHFRSRHMFADAIVFV